MDKRYSKKQASARRARFLGEQAIPPDLDEGMKAVNWACRSNEQGVSLKRAGISKRKRLNHLHRVATGAAEQIQEYKQRHRHRYRVAFITLTYRDIDGWQADHIKKLMAHYRNWAWRHGFKLTGLWVMELQERGAPHYHILLWLPKGLTPPMPDKQGWWQHGSTNCKWAYKAVGYVAKYTSKIKSKGGDMPKGARLFAVFGCPVHLGWWRAPNWLRQLTEKKHQITKKPGGWWCDFTRGWAWRSPWVLDYITDSEIVISWRGWSPGDVLPLYLLEAHWRITA